MTDLKPTLSIGLPIYNGDNFIARALDSILAQTYQDFEVVICDNASTDNTASICQQYAAKHPRIHYYRNEENLGAARNYNKAFRLAQGRYFKWAAHDDLCEPTYFEKCIDVLEKDSSVVLCYANTTVIDETGKPLSTYTEDLHLISPTPSTRYRQFNQRFLKKYKCNAVFGIIRTSVLQETDLIGHYEASDIILLAELALRGKVYEVPEHLFLRRDHPQMSGRANPTAQAIAAWFDPTNRKQLVLPMNRLLLEHIRAIHRVPMSTQERLRCYLQLLTFIRWKRREMGKELTEWLQVSMHGITHRTLHHPST